MDPHRWNDDTPATGSQPHEPRHNAGPAYGDSAHGDGPTYGDAAHADGPAYGDAPTYGGPGYGGPAYGGPGNGGPTYGRPGNGGPAHGGPAHGGPAHGGPAYGGPAHGDGPAYGGRAAYGDRSGYGAGPRYGDERGGFGAGREPDLDNRYGPGAAADDTYRPAPRYREYDDDFDEYPDDEPARRGWRSRTTIAVLVAFALVVGLATTGWLVLRPSSSPTHQVADPGIGGDPFGSGSGTPDPSLTSAPATTTKAAPKPTAKKTTAKPRPTPAQKPPAAQKPPPPPAPVPSSPSCTKHPGPDASKSAVSAALASAGQQNYWQGVVPPQGAPSPMPAFSVPARLMDAFAWTESSWQSTVIACDGGIGLMQLMSDNVAYLNQRFDFSPPLDVNTLNGNAQLGAAYIEWLTAYFGTYYFGSYDLMNATAAVGTGGVTVSLLDVVIAAYNVGPAEVEDTHGTADGSDDTLSIPNQSYVDKVNTAYANQPWLSSTTSPAS